MKKIIAAVLLMFPFSGTAVAQSDASITWSVQGVKDIKEITMDAKFTARYVAVNGSVTNTSNISLPITGTCFETNKGGVYCTFFIAGGALVELDLLPSLGGSIRSYDSNMNVRDSGNVTLANIF